jgi:hypothetical protein
MVVSKANRLRAVKVTDKTPAAAKVSKVANTAAVNRVVSKAIASSSAVTR